MILYHIVLFHIILDKLYYMIILAVAETRSVAGPETGPGNRGGQPLEASSQRQGGEIKSTALKQRNAPRYILRERERERGCCASQLAGAF